MSISDHNNRQWHTGTTWYGDGLTGLFPVGTTQLGQSCNKLVFADNCSLAHANIYAAMLDEVVHGTDTYWCFSVTYLPDRSHTARKWGVQSAVGLVT
jgi:hypothetical protein